MFGKRLLEELNRVAYFQWHITFLLLRVARWQAASRLWLHRHFPGGLSPFRGPECVLKRGEVQHSRESPSIGVMRLGVIQSGGRHSSDMRALGLDVNGVEGLAGGHEQTVAFFASKTNVRADFRQQNHPDSTAFRRKYVHAVVAIAHPARRGPEVAIDVAADAVGAAVAAYGPWADFCFDLLLRHSHVYKAALVI